MSEKYTSLEHTIRSIVTAPKQVNEYLQYAIPTAKTIFKMGTAPSNLPAVVNSTKAAATRAVPKAVKTVPTVPVTAIPVPVVAPTLSSTSPIAAALPAAISAASGVTPAVAPALSTLTKTQTAVAPQTLTKTAMATAAATAANVKDPKNRNSFSSGNFDSEARTAGNSRTLTTTKDIPKKRKKAVGESVNVIRRVIEEAKKKEQKGGKNPLVDLEPKLKDQEVDQG